MLRFLEKVNKSGGSEACWMWTSYTDSKGYGQIRIGDRCQRAHRVAWIMTNGPIPPGQFVCHRCDNPSCVNPAHLFLDNHAGNMADMVAKGRQARGERVSTNKLTPDQIQEISRLYSDGGITQADLGRRFGVTQQTIGDIVRRVSWSHLAEEGLA